MEVTKRMLVTLISYCSLERSFLNAIVCNSRMFSDLVVLCVGTRLYSGQPEDLTAPAEAIAEEDVDKGLAAVVTAMYDVPTSSLATPVVLHNAAREAGVAAARRWGRHEPFWALMLDGDEVPDGPAMREWWRGAGGDEARRSGSATVRKMANHWAFLSPRLVSEHAEDSVLLVHSDLLTLESLRQQRERDGIYLWHQTSPLGNRNVRVLRDVRGADGQPMFWHFSWVRLGADGSEDAETCRAALKAKVANWGHRDDCDWSARIDLAFDGLDLGAGRHPQHDFVHGHPLRLLDAVPRVLLPH